MFKPHIGICLCHGKSRLIVVKAGYCKEGNENRKKKSDYEKVTTSIPHLSRIKLNTKKVSPVFKFKKIQYRRKRTGEAEVFEKIMEEAIKASPALRCACCSCRIWEAGPGNFSHLLAKSTYPSLRLDPRNIWIVCLDCHHDWDFGNRNQIKFKAKRKRAAELKLEYYQKQKV